MILLRRRAVALTSVALMACLPLALFASGDDHGEATADFMLVLALALIAAKLAGELAERVGQPSVVGELLAGILLGRSVLGRVTALHLDPDHVAFALLAELGVVLLLFEVGLETDLREMLRAGRVSLMVAGIGVVVPFALGAGVVGLADHLGWITTPPGGHLLLSIFLGATLTATSVGITARVLQDLGRMHGLEARVLLGAAVIDDVIGLAILSAVTALGVAVAGGVSPGDAMHPGKLLLHLGFAVGFLAVAIAVGRTLAPRLFELVSILRVRGVLLVTALGFALLLAWATAKVGLALILGGFAAGLVLSETNQFRLIEERVRTVSDVITPLFFLIVGANVDVASFNVFDPARRPTLLLAGLLLVAAILGKLASGLGATGSGASRLAVGIGMIPRGEVGLIFAQAGLVLTLPGPDGPVRLVSRDVYSAVTMVVVLTTFMAPPALRAVFARREEPTP